MTAQEVANFKTERYGGDAVLIRQCDDKGKVAGLKTPGLTDYRSMIEAQTLGCALLQHVDPLQRL